MKEPNMSNTWNYLTPEETQEIPTEWVWERLRIRRNGLLARSDKKMIIDAPWDLEAWKEYRQALRDLPAQTEDPRAAIFPVAPDGYKVPAYVEPVVYVEPVIEEVIETTEAVEDDSETL
jgi:hypothetical protein